MNGKVEQWLAEQEVARLEAIYQLPSPSEPDDPGQVEAQTVRAVELRGSGDPSRPDSAIPG
jgi:hypothetical protein